MTRSILNDVLLLRKEPIEKIADYFKEINLTIFDTILSRESTNGDQTIQQSENRQAILFILTAYSEDSPLVILRQDAKEEKEGICDYLDIPDYMRDKLIGLTDQTIRTATTQYLERFSGFEFRNLMFMKIQLEDFERDITNRRYSSSKTESEGKDENGVEINKVVYFYDIKEHGKAIAESLRLSKAISALEKELKASQSTFKAIDEIKEWKTHGNHKAGKIIKRGSVENYIN